MMPDDIVLKNRQMLVRTQAATKKAACSRLPQI